MTAELLALCAAFGYASGRVAIKFATQGTNMVLGLLISLTTSMIVVASVAVVVLDEWAVSSTQAVLFVVGGLVGPGAGRILGMRATRDAGASVATPVQGSTSPLVATAAGVFLLSEVVDAGRLLALALIVSGIWACARGGSANRAPPSGDETPPSALARTRLLMWAVLAGAAFAGSDVFFKFALEAGGEPIIGVLIGLVTAVTVWLTAFLSSPQLRRGVQWTGAYGWFALSGLASAFAWTSLSYALQRGDLSVVAPIVAAQPVIVIILGAVVLRNLEQLRPGTVIGALVAFAGIAYLSVG